MRTLAATLSACLALGLVAAGCGDDDEGGSEPAKTSEEKQPAGGAAPRTVDVLMKDIEFKPKTVTVKTGGAVLWTNEDDVGHDVTGPDFKSGKPGGISKGAGFERRFDSAGTFKYRCTVHPGMEGTVVVK